MATFIAGLIIGGTLGICMFSLLIGEKYDIEMQTIYYETEDCQIHNSYLCKNQNQCKGNPKICEWSEKKW